MAQKRSWLEAIPKPHLGCKWHFFPPDGVGLHRNSGTIAVSPFLAGEKNCHFRRQSRILG